MQKIVEQKLSPAVFLALREKAGFPFYSSEDSSEALDHTLYTVEIREEERTVGMARVVGDNRIAFFIKDVVVDPDYHGQGIGKLLLEAIFGYIRQHACKNAYVGLMATPGTEEFYEKFGFIRRPSPGLGCGMVQYLSPAEGGSTKENEVPR